MNDNSMFTVLIKNPLKGEIKQIVCLAFIDKRSSTFILLVFFSVAKICVISSLKTPKNPNLIFLMSTMTRKFDFEIAMTNHSFALELVTISCYIFALVPQDKHLFKEFTFII